MKKKSLIIYPPKQDIEDMQTGDTFSFNSEGKHWTIKRDE